MKAGRAIHILLIAVVAAFLGSHFLLNSKKIQQEVAGYAGNLLAETLGTGVITSSIKLAHPCGISIKDLLIYDHLGDTLISATGVVIQFRVLPLLQGKMDITRINLTNPYINIYRQDSGSTTNLGATLVHASSLLQNNRERKLALRANSVYIRNGKIRYNDYSRQETPLSFNTSHILLNRFTTTISLKHLSTDSINARLRKLSFSEHSGINVDRANCAIKAGKDNILVNNLALSSNNSKLEINRFEAFKTALGYVWNIGLSTTVKGSDFVALLPQAYGMDKKVSIALYAEGNEDEYNINHFDIISENNTFNLGVRALIKNHNDKTTPYSIDKFSIEDGVITGSASSELYSMLNEQLHGFGISIPKIIKNIGEVKTEIALHGSINEPNIEAEIVSKTGGDAQISVISNNEKQALTISGSQIDLGHLTGNSKFGKSSLQLTANGDILNRTSSTFTFSGNVSSLIFNNYAYNNITIDGTLLNDTINTTMNFNDNNANIFFKANVLPDATDTYADINLNIKDLNLTNLNFTNRDSLVVSANIKANSLGNTVDIIQGKLSIDSLSYCDTEGSFQSNRQISLTINEEDSNSRNLSFRSDFANIDIVGDYNISTLPNSLGAVLDITLPTLYDWIMKNKPNTTTTKVSTNRFVVDAQLVPTNFYKNVLHIPLTIHDVAILQCSVNDNSNTASVTAYIPSLSLKDNYIRNGSLKLASDHGDTNIGIEGNYSSGINPGSNIVVDLSASNDRMSTTIHWKDVNKNELDAQATIATTFEDFDKRNDWLKSKHYLEESNVTYNHVDWDVSNFNISTDSGKINIDHFILANNNQSVSADGVISADSTDVLSISVNNINIANILNMFNFNRFSFEGLATADISATSLLNAPTFNGHLEAKNFSFLGSYGGDLTAEGVWNQELECIDITAQMKDDDKSETQFSGYYSPKNRFIDINIDANRTDLYFLNTFTKNIFREVSGKAIGDLRIFGNLSSLDLEGKAILDDGILDQEILNTKFIIKHDTLAFEPGRMIFRNVDFYDEKGNKGLLMCDIKHNNLNEFSVDMDAYITNMQVLNIPRTETTDIFANVFASGTINLTTSNSKGLVVNAQATTAPGTTFGYNLYAGPVADNSFLKIVDAGSTESEISADLAKISNETNNQKDKEESSNTNVQLNFIIDCTDDAEIELLMDPLNGMVRGNGQIRANYSNTQGISLLGRYNVTNGLCNFSLENFIRKDFKFSDNSFVTFNGHPSTAELNLHTIHTVNSASLSDLDVTLPSNNNVRVNCLMDITGTVATPSLAFNIDLPQGSQEEKEAIRSSTSTEEQTHLQFMYLLTMGRFYSYDYANTGVSTSPGAVESFFNSTINTQINNMLSQVIDNNNFTLSSNVSAGSYLNNDPANLTNKEFEGIMEAHLLNNRLLINGNFGYRENAMTNTSNFIGDFEGNLLLIKKPKISVLFYNKSNDRYFSKTSLNTQGVGIVYEADF